MSLGLGLVNLVSASWVSPGWEIYDTIGAMKFDNTICTNAFQFTSPNDVSGPYWKVDIDAPTWRIPTIMSELSDVRHTDFAGRDLTYDKYVDTRTVTIGNDTFYLDYHIYTFTINIRTVADKQVVSISDPVNPTRVYHETAWPYIGQDGLIFGGGHLSGQEHGMQFNGGVFVKFVINPWRGVPERTAPNSSYYLSNVWAGIMNAYVISKSEGKVANQWGSIPNPVADAQPFVKGGLDEGAQVPMFEDDGTFGKPATTVNWGPNVTPDTRIESTVVLYLPTQLMPGADTHHDVFGNVDDIYPIDVNVQYTVRVDVLQTHDYTLQGSNKPPALTWPHDYFGWAQDWWTSFLGGLDPFAFLGPLEPLAWFIVTMIAIGFIILIFLAVFAPWVLPKIFGGLRQARDFAYESVEKRPRRKSR